MATFDKHLRCAGCRHKGHRADPYIRVLPCEHCGLLTPEQAIQLATPTDKMRKEKRKSKYVLVDLTSLSVVSQVQQEDADLPASHYTSADISLPQPSFCK